MFWGVFLSLCLGWTGEMVTFGLSTNKLTSLGGTVTGVYYFRLGPFYGVSCLLSRTLTEDRTSLLHYDIAITSTRYV